MVAPSVHLFLHSSSPKSAISVPPFVHSSIWRKCKLRRSEACPVSRCPGQGRVRSSPWLGDSSLGSFQAQGTDKAETCSISGIDSRQADLGRCALVSAAAVLLIQCAFGEEFAIAATYSPAVVAGQQSSSSFSVNSFSRFNAASVTPASTSLMKKVTRIGSHAKGTDGAVKQSIAGLRKPVSLVKRPSGGLPRMKSNLIARQIASSSVAAFPVASISVGTLGNSFGALARLGGALDLSVLRSSFGTSVNLLSLCTLVVWMQRSGQLPADTPVILSQVAFKLFIPCFLLSKVATTLSSSSASNLVALPLMAFAQVIVGAMLGKVAGQVFFKVPSLQPAVNWSGNQAGDSMSSTAFIDDQQRVARAATKKQALITAACAFGNSLTLPLVFISGVLATTEEANLAAGYLALYMVGWSPAMWSVGYKILTAGDEEEESKSEAVQPTWRSVFKWIGSVMNPPLYGVLVGLLIGGTPLSHLFLGGKEGAVLATTPYDTVEVFAKLRSVTAGILSPVFEAVSLLGTATLAVQTVVLATSLGASMAKPGESVKKISHNEADTDSPPLPGDVGTSSLATTTTTNETVVLDNKAFWVISGIRLILLPFSGILFTFILQCLHMLPADPIYRLVILAESAMPTAQNLVLLAQLNAGTRPLAGMLASLLLRQYALSVFPLTIWMAIFLSFIRVT